MAILVNVATETDPTLIDMQQKPGGLHGSLTQWPTQCAEEVKERTGGHSCIISQLQSVILVAFTKIWQGKERKPQLTEERSLFTHSQNWWSHPSAEPRQGTHSHEGTERKSRAAGLIIKAAGPSCCYQSWQGMVAAASGEGKNYPG